MILKSMFRKVNYNYLVLFVLALSACEKQDVGQENAIGEKFNGKYALLTAIANQPVDMNLDGVESTNLSAEVENLSSATVELRIGKNSHLFTQFWQEQYITEGQRPDRPYVTYARQGIGFSFTFQNNASELILNKDHVKEEDAARFAVPSQVKVLANDVIEVVFDKKVFTSRGWKQISITARYKRYTNVT